MNQRRPGLASIHIKFGGYATLTSRDLDPAECDHSRRTAHDSHRCLDCRQDVGPGEADVELARWLSDA